VVKKVGMRACRYDDVPYWRHNRFNNDEVIREESQMGRSAMEIMSSALKKYNYFSSFSDGALEALAGKIKLIKFSAGSLIVKEGSMGDAFYFVKQGQLEITKKTKSGEVAKLSVIGSGQGFGEMALLTCSVRSSSVRAITDVELFELSKSTFEDVVLQESAFKSMLYQKTRDHMRFNRIKTLQPFQLLEPAKMYAAMEKMIEKKYATGEDIITQGEKGDFYYIIKSGRVSVLKKKKGEEEYRQIAVLSEGDAFGEEALIRDDPRNATCRAEEGTTVLALNKKDFDQIVKAAFMENIFPEEIPLETYLDDFVVIDARIPAEYEDEHIYGAINIPVEVLREKCAEFDKSKQYITYCLNDSRGMVATFLLRNRGFNSRCLRGGVSGWMGEVVTGSDGVQMPGK
jgi:CRP-like cAMP-binding protein/rhodanese-related sulfurtransferase